MEAEADLEPGVVEWEAAEAEAAAARSSLDWSPEIRSTSLAREAEVVALETGCLGRELRRGGDFLGNGAEMKAWRVGLFWSLGMGC